MKYVRFFSILPVLLVIIAACRISESPTNTGGNIDGTMITTTIAGAVNDEVGQPIAGATVTVSANGIVKHSAITNKFGSFMIQNTSVPESRCFILCKKNGYFTGSRAEVPKAGGITEMRITMQSNAAAYSVNAGSGGKINIGNASVSFPANAFVTNSGVPYTGTVNVAAKFLDPTKTSFYNSFSGDMTATRSDGSQTELLSYGVLRVEIKDATGNELKIATGKTASLSYPLATSMQKDAPDSMPLWYFDETLGMWKEEGVAVKTGNIYTGEVAHFSSWNCDIPTQTGIVKGRVVCNGNEGVEGVYVTIGERKIVTDMDGNFTCRVPMNLDITISINATENSGMSAPDMKVTGLSGGEVRTLDNINLSSCPATVNGTIVDCNTTPVAGTIVVTVNGAYIYRFTATGIFKIRVPSGLAMNVEATTYDGKLGLPVSVPTVNSGDSYSIGTISACENGSTAEFYDISYGSGFARNAKLSPDGSIVVINGDRQGSTSFVEVYDVMTKLKLSSFVTDSSEGTVDFTADGSKLLIQTDYNSMAVVNPHTGAIVQTITGFDGRILPDGSGVITITGYAPVKLALFSVADGAKIKDLSYTGSDYPKIIGLRNTNQVQLLINNNNSCQIINWDYSTDTKVSDISIPNAGYYYNTAGFSPDGTIAGFQDTKDPNTLNFYNTATGAKLNSVPFTVPGGNKRGDASYLGVANDNTFVIQGSTIDGQAYLQPTTYNLLNGVLQKVLAVPSENVRYSQFNFSSNSQYLVGVPSDYSFNPKYSVRVWKLK